MEENEVRQLGPEFEGTAATYGTYASGLNPVNRMRIAFSGPMGVGKSTAAQVLVEHGWIKCSLADAVRIVAAAATGRTDLWIKPLSLGARETLQRVGHAIRELDPDFWVRLLTNFLIPPNTGRAVVDDVRYPNEASWLRSRGYLIVHICRQPYCRDSLNAGHPSERSAAGLDVDLVLHNDGTIADLAKKVLSLVGR